LVDGEKFLAGHAVGFSSPLRDFELSLSLELRCNGWGRGFLAHLHSPWGYDEPEILRYSNRQFAPIGADAGHARGRLYRAIQDLLARYDALVMPTTTRTALDVGFDAANDEVEVDGVKCGITRLGWNSALYPFNLTGHPAITIPSGFAADGLPTALQIVGRWGAETDMMRLAAVQETARPWAQAGPITSAENLA
jgi:Asp-tRNA(Asn)/Glu-tRNA(Gln) amidotransferase A subunit family amidase